MQRQANSDEMNTSTERQAVEYQGRWLGRWMEELKASVGLRFTSNQLTFKALILPFSFLSVEINSN